ncbi:ATP phosphoribosyltransferase [Chloroflexota bacterium]
MPIKIALPKGRLLKKTALLLQKADWGLDEYHSRISFYHPKSQRFPHLIIKVFQEKDIPVQVAIGNYDMGICGQDWVQELLAKYPSSSLVKIKDLDYGHISLYAAASISRDISLSKIKAKNTIVRIASEYPNLAETFALQNRLRRFSIFPVWGAAEGYPPENAELALISAQTIAEIGLTGLSPVSKVMESGATLVANRNSWENKDLGEIISSICDEVSIAELPASGSVETYPEQHPQYPPAEITKDTVRIALPDGHQQQPTLELLNRAGIPIEDYPSSNGNRRPRIGLEGISVKVIRPQDMPLQVTNGNFDLAITGKDWLWEHHNQFPSSPVRDIADLKYGQVKIVAVVSQELPVNDTVGLRQYCATRSSPLRIASEYTHIADKYARDNHLGYYRIVPTWGATEAFLPEDADVLIENTQTGSTIARHNLRIIDTLFKSAACLIGSTRTIASQIKKDRSEAIAAMLRDAAEET